MTTTKLTAPQTRHLTEISDAGGTKRYDGRARVVCERLAAIGLITFDFDANPSGLNRMFTWAITATLTDAGRAAVPSDLEEWVPVKGPTYGRKCFTNYVRSTGERVHSDTQDQDMRKNRAWFYTVPALLNPRGGERRFSSWQDGARAIDAAR